MAGVAPGDKARRMVSVTSRIGPDVVFRPAAESARWIVSLMAWALKAGARGLKGNFMRALSVAICKPLKHLSSRIETRCTTRPRIV